MRISDALTCGFSSAAALPIALTLTTAIAIATTVPMTNCVMLFGMIPSIALDT